MNMNKLATSKGFVLLFVVASMSAGVLAGEPKIHGDAAKNQLNMDAMEKAKKLQVRPGTSWKQLPDLTATANISTMQMYKNPQGVQCYAIRPIFTITNKGAAAAANFRYEIEWNYNPSHSWQTYTAKSNVSLDPGKTIQIKGSTPAWNLPWCQGEQWTPGWRIRVDTWHAVSETNEQNNDAFVLWTPPSN